MKKYFLLINLIFFFSYSAFSIEIPPGGTNMINDPISNYSQIGSQGTVNIVNVEHTEFTKAIKVDVTSQPDNYWNFQVVFQTNMALEIDDVCLVSLWARTTKSNSEAGDGLLTAIIEHKDTYEKPLSHTFIVVGEWTHFVYAFKSSMNLTLDKHKAALFFGHAVQTIEVANIQFLNYKKTKTIDELPAMAITYAGMELDAPWRVDAIERIEKFRKGNVLVKLVDSNNNPVSNANVTLEMKKHKFGFGSAIDGNIYLTNTTYRNHVHELFNEVVFENDLKWKPWVTRSSHSYILTAINNLNSFGIDVRGHNLIWPGWSYLPSFMELYKNNAARLRSESLDHIEETAGYTKGKLIDWDVINEPYTNHVIQDVTGDEIMADWFKKTKDVDPDVKRYINDYSIIGNGGVDINHQNGYFDIIEYIDEKGGEIDGIGLQGHFAELVTGIPKVIEILDRFATFNKEIKITEFDINSTNDELKVNYSRDFMTVLFSHPHVKGILSWGFWEGRHWKPNAAIYNLDWTIRLQGEMYKNLVFDEWWTITQNLTSNEQGNSNFGECFLGSYEVNVVSNGTNFTKSIPIHFNLENNITINVDDQTFTIEGADHPETPVFTSAKKVSELKVEELKIYPNPATTYINIDLQEIQNEDCQIQIINVSGSCVHNQYINLMAGNIIQLSNMESGLYFLSVQNTRQKWTGRFIKK